MKYVLEQIFQARHFFDEANEKSGNNWEWFSDEVLN